MIGPNEDIERAYFVRRTRIDNSPEAVERLGAEVLAPFGAGDVLRPDGSSLCPVCDSPAAPGFASLLCGSVECWRAYVAREVSA